MPHILRSAELPNGLHLPYAEQGDPAGVPLILLHGITDSWHSFEAVLSHLPSSIRALALTQRGHGDADRPPGYRTRDFSADVAAFMDVLGIDQAVIVGHSMGSTNAARFAIDHPQRTLGLVLAGAFAGYRNNAGMVDYCETAISPLVDPIEPAFALDFQQSTLAQPVPQALLETAVRESLKLPARVWRAAFEGLLEDDFVDDLWRINVPTLLLWGARDAYCPRVDQQALLAAIAQSRLVVYEQAGHALHWEEPQRFAGDVAAFALQVATEPLAAV